MYTCATKLADDLLNQKLAGDPYTITQKKHIRGCSSWFCFGNEKIKHFPVTMEICSKTQLKANKMNKSQMAELQSLYSIFQHNDTFFFPPLIELCKSDK